MRIVGLLLSLLACGIIFSFQPLSSHLWLQSADPRLSEHPGQKASSHTSFSFIKQLPITVVSSPPHPPSQPNTNTNQCVLTHLSGYVRTVMQWG